MSDDLDSLNRYREVQKIVDTAVNSLTLCIFGSLFLTLGLGVFLSLAAFIYWMYFLAILDILLVSGVISILRLAIKHLLIVNRAELIKNDVKDELKKHTLSESIKSGIIGNIGFYLFIGVVIIVAKFAGIFDKINMAVNSVANK